MIESMGRVNRQSVRRRPRRLVRDTQTVDKQAVHDEMEQIRATFHRLLDEASDADLRRPSQGTRWNNRQLLFHMLLGYLILRALTMLVRVFGRLPDRVSRTYARLLNKATTPFDAVNYLGSRLGGSFLSRKLMSGMFDRVIAKLHRRLDAETDADLARGMHYPTRWDPFFQDFMTLADVYRFPAQHFEFHRRQLTLEDPDAR
jgi:DinB family protein